MKQDASSILVPMSAVQEKEAAWLVPGYMPRGQINIWAGDGGVGKTTAWCDLAAAVSTGRQPFFERTVPEDFAQSEPGRVNMTDIEKDFPIE